MLRKEGGFTSLEALGALLISFAALILFLVFSGNLGIGFTVNGTAKQAGEALANDAAAQGCLTTQGEQAAQAILQAGGMDPAKAVFSTTDGGARQTYGAPFTVSLSYPWQTGGAYQGNYTLLFSQTVISAWNGAAAAETCAG